MKTFRIRVASFFCLVLITMAAGCGDVSPSARARAEYQRAEKFRDEGQFDSARVAVQQAIDLDSLLPHAYQLRAFMRYKNGEPLDASIADMQKSIRLFGDSADSHAYLNLAKYAHKAGRKHDAIQAYLRTIRLDSTFADGHLELAHIYEFQGDTSNALIHYEKFLRFAPQGDTLIDFAKEHIALLTRR